MIPFCKVFHIDNQEVYTNLSGKVLNLTVNKGTEAVKNSCTFEFQNHNGELNNQNFVIDQSTLVVWMDWDPIPVDSDGYPTSEPIMSAFVTSINYPQGTDGKYKIKLKCTDKTGLFLSKVWAFAYTESANKNAPEIIINLIGHAEDLSNNATKYINGTLTSNNVSLTKHDGTAFPRPVIISKIWKPMYEWLNELSTPQYTGEDLTYVYYVDAKNDLHWNYPYQKVPINLTAQLEILDTTVYVTDTSSYPPIGNLFIDREVISYTGKTATSFTGLSRGKFNTRAAVHLSGAALLGDVLWVGRNNIYSIDIGSTEDAIYNMIIYNGGKTPAGYDFLWYKTDSSQRGRSFRMKFFDWTSEAQALTNNEKANKTGWPDSSKDYPQTYPYTTLWGATVNNDNEYQDAFKVELQNRCDNKCLTYFFSGRQKYSGTIQMRGTNQYTINEMINVYHLKFNDTKLLRIKSIKHQLNKGSWITTIEAETDPIPSAFTGQAL